MKFVYVHHGNRKIMKTPNENDNLTLIGKKDCTLVAKLLNNPEVKQNAKVIFTAPNPRCRKTAKIINRHIKLPIIEDALLNEFDKKHETWVDCQNRIISFIENALKTYHQTDMVICVTSGVNVAGFICKAFNISASNKNAFVGVPSCSPLIFEIN